MGKNTNDKTSDKRYPVDNNVNNDIKCCNHTHTVDNNDHSNSHKESYKHHAENDSHSHEKHIHNKHLLNHDHHHHHHHHHHAENLRGRRLLWVTLLNIAITVAEIIGGLVSNSLSLLSDAIHNLGDSSAIFIAFIAGRYSKKKPDMKKTFGYKRAEIIAALFNAVVLIAICIFLFVEAYHRFRNPEPIRGKLMFIVAVIGLLANLISVIILHKDKSHNLNIKAAYLHLLGDTLSSVAVIIGGIVIWKWKIYWLDPVITVLVGVYIIIHTWDIVKECVDILMQAVPHNIDVNKIKKEVESINNVQNMHHVHVWKLDDERIFLEAHINLVKDMQVLDMMKIQQNIVDLLKENFNIDHITLQFGYNCCDGFDELIIKTKE